MVRTNLKARSGWKADRPARFHYEPEMRTGFIGAGPGLRLGAAAPLLPIECVAPTVAALLGIPFHAADGMVFPGLLSDPP